jgi:hypothetical protein
VESIAADRSQRFMGVIRGVVLIVCRVGHKDGAKMCPPACGAIIAMRLAFTLLLAYMPRSNSFGRGLNGGFVVLINGR